MKTEIFERYKLQKMIRVKTCINEEGLGGSEAGLVFLNKLNHIGYESKINIVRKSGLHEVAFLCILDNRNYLIEFFDRNQEIKVCGHLSLAAGQHLLCQMNKEITLILKDKQEIKLVFQDRIPAVIFSKPATGVIYNHVGDDNKFYDSLQEKEIVLLENTGQLVNLDADKFQRPTLFAAQSGENEYTVRYFRSGKEDPFHVSGLVPLQSILERKGTSTNKTTFCSFNGGKVNFEENAGKYIMSGDFVDLSKQRSL